MGIINGNTNTEYRPNSMDIAYQDDRTRFPELGSSNSWPRILDVSLFMSESPDWMLWSDGILDKLANWIKSGAQIAKSHIAFASSAD